MELQQLLLVGRDCLQHRATPRSATRLSSSEDVLSSSMSAASVNCRATSLHPHNVTELLLRRHHHPAMMQYPSASHGPAAAAAAAAVIGLGTSAYYGPSASYYQPTSPQHYYMSHETSLSRAHQHDTSTFNYEARHQAEAAAAAAVLLRDRLTAGGAGGGSDVNTYSCRQLHAMHSAAAALVTPAQSSYTPPVDDRRRPGAGVSSVTSYYRSPDVAGARRPPACTATAAAAGTGTGGRLLDETAGSAGHAFSWYLRPPVHTMPAYSGSGDCVCQWLIAPESTNNITQHLTLKVQLQPHCMRYFDDWYTAVRACLRACVL